MATNKEFTIRLEDRPGTLGKLCQAIAEQSVNILAFQSLAPPYASSWTIPARMRPCYFSGLKTPIRRRKFWSRPPLPPRRTNLNHG